jgi:cobalamin synthase
MEVNKMETKQTMWKELIGKLDEMYGATLLAGIALYAMYMQINGGVVEMAITGVIALLVSKAVRSNKP